MKVIRPIPLTAGTIVSSSALETHAEYDPAIGYALDSKCTLASTGMLYQCIQGPSLGNAPDTSPLYWAVVSPSNRAAMFDSKISTQTQAPDTLTVVLKPGYCNSLCLFGLVATTLTITVRDGLAGPVVYSTTSALDGTVITDWYQYYFEPAVQLSSIVLSNLPPHQNAYVTITIAGTGFVKCGICVVGSFYELGDVQYGATSTITDYSRKDTDAFGTTTFVKRNYSDRITAELMFNNAQLNKVKSVLVGLRATPCAWIGTDAAGFEVLNTFGFYRDFTTTIAYPTQSLCALEIEGLT